jgi:hypothetical protein
MEWTNDVVTVKFWPLFWPHGFTISGGGGCDDQRIVRALCQASDRTRPPKTVTPCAADRIDQRKFRQPP